MPFVYQVDINIKWKGREQAISEFYQKQTNKKFYYSLKLKIESI